MSPFFRGLAFIPQMLAVKVVFGVKTQLVRVNVRHGDGFFAVRRDLPHLFRVGIKEIPAAIIHDTDAGMRLRRGSRQHQNEYANQLLRHFPSSLAVKDFCRLLRKG
jgi:hypothetical protein